MKNGLFKIEDAEEYEFSRVYYVKNHFSVTRERKLKSHKLCSRDHFYYKNKIYTNKPHILRKRNRRNCHNLGFKIFTFRTEPHLHS